MLERLKDKLPPLSASKLPMDRAFNAAVKNMDAVIDDELTKLNQEGH